MNRFYHAFFTLSVLATFSLPIARADFNADMQNYCEKKMKCDCSAKEVPEYCLKPFDLMLTELPACCRPMKLVPVKLEKRFVQTKMLVRNEFIEEKYVSTKKHFDEYSKRLVWSCANPKYNKKSCFNRGEKIVKKTSKSKKLSGCDFSSTASMSDCVLDNFEKKWTCSAPLTKCAPAFRSYERDKNKKGQLFSFVKGATADCEPFSKEGQKIIESQEGLCSVPTDVNVEAGNSNEGTQSQ